MEIKERIQLLLSEMNRGVYEKEAEIGLSLLAALAGLLRSDSADSSR